MLRKTCCPRKKKQARKQLEINQQTNIEEFKKLLQPQGFAAEQKDGMMNNGGVAGPGRRTTESASGRPWSAAAISGLDFYINIVGEHVNSVDKGSGRIHTSAQRASGADFG